LENRLIDRMQDSSLRQFRFGVHLNPTQDAQAFCQRARRAEELGYSTLTVADHFRKQFACLPAVLAAGLATTTLRVGPLVLGNDYKHPVVLAKELATIDQFTDGRLQVGIGAGWLREDYDWSGISYDRAGVRVARLEESIELLKRLWSGVPVNFNGEHYAIEGLVGSPLPVQRPRPPIMVGAGGKRMLQLAARHADIINISVNQSAGVHDAVAVMAAAGNQQAGINQRRIEWIKEAAGDRFSQIELGAITHVLPTDNRRSVVRATAERLGLNEADLLDSPQYLIGSPAEMIADLQRRRSEQAISYVVFFGDMMEQLAPVVDALAGT
jgi:probable F420-dependent oxidoreductase